MFWRAFLSFVFNLENGMRKAFGYAKNVLFYFIIMIAFNSTGTLPV